MKTIVEFLGEKTQIDIFVENEDDPVVYAVGGEGEIFGVISTRLGIPLDEGEFCVKTYSENKGWAEAALENLSKYFEYTGKRVKSGFVEFPIYRLTPAAADLTPI
jgi:hypothetical protein